MSVIQEVRPVIALRSNALIDTEVDDPQALWRLLANQHTKECSLAGDAVYKRLLLAGLDLSSCRGNRTRFEECDFTGADLTRASFEDAVFNQCTFAKSGPKTLSAPRSTFFGCSFANFQFTAAGLTDTDMSESCFTTAYFDTVVASHGLFRSTEWAASRCLKSNFKGADFLNSFFENTSFVECDLTGASFNGATFKDVRFTSCDMSGVDLYDATFEDTALNNCELAGVTLRNASGIDPDKWTNCTNVAIAVLLRRAYGSSAKSGIHAYMMKALRTLWLQHLLTGGDVLEQPFDQLIGAAEALADRLEAEADADMQRARAATR